MRSLIPILIALSVGACKARDPEAGGLISDDPPVLGDKVHIAKGGEFSVDCAPADGDAMLGTPTYAFEVEGAANAGDEAQELLVTVKKSWSGRQDVLAQKELGHGVVSETGPLFVGFSAGVLTADATNVAGKRAYLGILTLASDGTEGLKVSCTVLRAH